MTSYQDEFVKFVRFSRRTRKTKKVDSNNGTTLSFWHSCKARLAQSVERETFNLKAKGSSPLSGEFFLLVI